MNSFGKLIGLVVERDGKKKDVQEPIIEVLMLKNITKSLESMSGLIGECKHILRNQLVIFGKRS
jgi:hypothetical protein